MVVADILGPDGLIVLVVAVILLFGANRLPGLARSLGEAARELKHGQADSEPDSGHAGAHPKADTITLTNAELDSLLTAREASARRDTGKRDHTTG